MKYFKDKNTNEVYAYDQEQIDGGWVKEGLTAMTDEEVYTHLNPVKTREQLNAEDEFEVVQLRIKVDKDITPLQDADELGIATKEELNKLKELKTFRVLLNRWEYPKEIPKYPEV